MSIRVQGLSKAFDDVQAVAEVSFEIQEGELFGLLGPNGAGKTTTINMLTGLARPDSGSIHVGGIDCTRNVKAAQHLVGVVPDESNLYPELTGRQNLTFCAALYGIPKREREERARRLIDQFGLSDAADRKFAGYSKGMKRKLTIAAGIIHRPPILFLDEPTTGIDVASARQIRQLIASLNADGTTILLTTHYIEEAERLCGRIAFIVRGRIVRIDRVSDLLQPLQEKHVAVIEVSDAVRVDARALAAAFPKARFETPKPGEVRVESHVRMAVGPIVRFLEEAGVEVAEARRVRPSLEEVFVQVTGIEADAMRGEKPRAGGRT
ncbi:MAG: ABC transporter ATP-binding protein [Candidatus Bipolaricaulota bacterium]